MAALVTLRGEYPDGESREFPVVFSGKHLWRIPGNQLDRKQGRPLGEDLAWRGGIVMNSEAELDQAFREYAEGSFAGRR